MRIENIDARNTAVAVQTELGEKWMMISEDQDGMLHWSLNETCHKCDRYDCYGYAFIGGTIGKAEGYSVTDTLELMASLADAATLGEFWDYGIPVDYVYSDGMDGESLPEEYAAGYVRGDS